jgi:hypothetical protein
MNPEDISLAIVQNLPPPSSSDSIHPRNIFELLEFTNDLRIALSLEPSSSSENPPQESASTSVSAQQLPPPPKRVLSESKETITSKQSKEIKASLEGASKSLPNKRNPFKSAREQFGDEVCSFSFSVLPCLLTSLGRTTCSTEVITFDKHGHLLLLSPPAHLFTELSDRECDEWLFQDFPKWRQGPDPPPRGPTAFRSQSDSKVRVRHLAGEREDPRHLQRHRRTGLRQKNCPRTSLLVSFSLFLL